jgi:hypothetical protein
MSTAEQRRQQNLRPTPPPVATPKLPGALTAKGGTGYKAPVAPVRDTEFISRGIGLPEDLRRTPVKSGVSRNVQAPEPPAVAQPRTPEIPDFRDSSYNAQIAALDRALRDFETGATTRGERYGQDFTTGLNRLGFRPGVSSMGMPNIVEASRRNEKVELPPVEGDWDYEGQADRTSAAARGTRGMRDEFAGRGTLRSSDFVNSFDDFQTRLQQQFDAMQLGRGRFAEDLGTELTQFRDRTQEQRGAAEESARNRAIMQAISQMGF